MATSTSSANPADLSGVIAALNLAIAGGNPGAPDVSNAGMFPSPKSPYNSLSDQISDAFILSGVMPGMKTNPMGGNNVPRYDFKNAPATLGGATYGTTAYSGFNPYLGRGNNVPGIFTPPGPGAGGPPGSGGPPGGTTPPPYGPRSPTPQPTPPGYNPLPPPGLTQPPPGTPPFPGQPPLPSYGGQRTDPTRPSGAPVSGITPRDPYQVGLVPGAPHTSAITPNQAGAPAAAPRSAAASGGQNPAYPTPKYPIAELKVPGAVAGQTDPQSMADYFMSLPPAEQMNYFNAISQYGLTTGQNLGGALDAALRQTMGNQQFAAWLQNKDSGQGSTITDRVGLPDWVINGLGG